MDLGREKSCLPPPTLWSSAAFLQTHGRLGLRHVVPARAGDAVQVSADVEVFRGVQRLLKEKHPGIICEMHGQENRRSLLEEFLRFAYTCTPCGASRILALPQ